MIKMATWAFIDEKNTAINFVESNGVPGYIPNGCTAVEIPPSVSYGYGWVWNGTTFDAVTSPVPVPESITRRQCALQLLALGQITDAEAIAMTRDGTPPASVQAYIDALPSASDRTAALIDFAAANYYRDNPTLTALMQANGNSPEQIDQFFISAASR